jgi:hypothetical protein
MLHAHTCCDAHNCSSILHGVPASPQHALFPSHILHCDCFLHSLNSTQPACHDIVNSFKLNSKAYFSRLYDFLLTAELSFDQLCEIMKCLGISYAQQIAVRSCSDLRNYIEHVRDGFATCSNLSTILCDVHTFTRNQLLINLWRALPRSRRYRYWSP